MLERLLRRSSAVTEELARQSTCAISDLAKAILRSIDYSRPLWHLAGPYTAREKILAHRVVELEAQIRRGLISQR